VWFRGNSREEPVSKAGRLILAATCRKMKYIIFDAINFVAGQGECRFLYCPGKYCLKKETHDDKFPRVVYTFVSGKAMQWAD